MALTTPTPTSSPIEGRAAPSTPAGPTRSDGAWRPFAVALVALVLAALLNGDELARTAERQPVGWQRDVLIELAAVPEGIADATGLDRPRRWAKALTGEDRAGSATTDGTPTAPPPPASVPPDGAEAPAPDPTTSPTGAPSTTGPARRSPTATAPLQVAVVGDSMMQVLGQSVVNAAVADDRFQLTLEYRVSTGLTRPDHFDWPTRIAQLVADGPPDVAVVMFGANDAQGMVLPDGSEPFGTPRWLEEYRRRVAWVMDHLATAGVDTVWVGQPVMRSESFSARMATLNEVYASEAEGRAGVAYVDAWSVLSVDGAYATHIDDGTGPTAVRQSDGIHLSRAGGDRLAAVLLDEIRDRWELDR